MNEAMTLAEDMSRPGDESINVKWRGFWSDVVIVIEKCKRLTKREIEMKNTLNKKEVLLSLKIMKMTLML